MRDEVELGMLRIAIKENAGMPPSFSTVNVPKPDSEEFHKVTCEYVGKTYVAHGRNFARAQAFLLREIADDILAACPAFD